MDVHPTIRACVRTSCTVYVEYRLRISTLSVLIGFGDSNTLYVDYHLWYSYPMISLMTTPSNLYSSYTHTTIYYLTRTHIALFYVARTFHDRMSLVLTTLYVLWLVLTFLCFATHTYQSIRFDYCTHPS